jgi:uncharacterized membrane protein
MNKLLVAIFNTEAAADTGLQALRALHATGDITVYATGVLAKDAQGVVSVKQSMDAGPVGTATGLAVGSMAGLLGGPAGLVAGAVTGTLVGALRDFWAAGVGLDFVEEALHHLMPGKAALVAEVEEEWIVPADVALEAAGGQVMRRTRSELAQSQFDHDITALKAEIEALKTEASDAAGAAKGRLQTQLAKAEGALEGAMQRASRRTDVLKHEAEAKAESLRLQLGQVQSDLKWRIEARTKRVKAAYHARSAKLSQAWSLTKDALTA